MIKRATFIILLTIGVILIYIFAVKQPSNERNWEVGFQTLPHFTISDSTVSIANVRDQEYIHGTEFKQNYFNKSYDAKNITRVWFLVSKFNGFHGLDGIAHTHFMFDMKDSEPITVSVEARREKGEKYDIVGGLFNNFELMYVWASERDSLIRRTKISKDRVYMFPLVLSAEASQRLFLQLAQRAQKLETHPRFYNSFSSNCTNELAKSANEVKPGTIPWNIAYLLPGYAPKELHKLGYITGEGTIEEIENRHYITDFVSEHYNDPLLGKHLRESLGTQ